MNTLSKLPSSTSNTATKWGQQAGDKAHAAVERLSDGAHHVVDSLQSAAQRAEPHGRRWMSVTQDYVRLNPLKSLGLAVVAGMVVRQFVRR